jgi:hypothetical protein
MSKKVAFITSILGNYELTCKPFVEQTVDSDFICFTDNPNIKSNGWIIDTTPYHDTHKSPVDNGLYNNSITKEGRLKVLENRHTFNLAKYYKQSWKNIPRLKDYDVVIWLDGTIEITKGDVSEYMIELCEKYDIVSWHHEMRGGLLFHEAFSCYLEKYHNRNYLNQQQPYQDVISQYHTYLQEGYDEGYFLKYPRIEGRGRGDHFGVWITCFVAFNNRSEKVTTFLDEWYLQTLKYTTQDQVGFPKVVQDLNLVPYTLPDKRFGGNDPHVSTDIFIKHDHKK